MAILVCGGAGFIGSHFVEFLLEQGEAVVVVDNLATGHRASLPEGPFYQLSLADKASLAEIFREHDIEAVVHFAAFSLVGESMDQPLKYFENNVCATNALLQVMIEAGCDKLIFSSTAAVYGEAGEALIRETDPTRPTNAYGESKLMMEKIIDWAARSSDLRYIALRYFNVAGASAGGRIGEDHRPETHLIPLAIKAALNDQPIKLFGDDYPTPDGTCIRDYIHVQDLVAAHYLALNALRDGAASDTFNLGYGRGYSVRQILEAVEAVAKRALRIVRAPRRAGDPARLVASADKIKQALGWKPRHDDLNDIILSAYRWFEANPKGYPHD